MSTSVRERTTPPGRRTPSRRGGSDLHRLGAIALVVGALWGVVGVYALAVALPASPLDLPFAEERALTIRALVPQGWAFFTRSPREPRVIPYAPAEDGTWRSVHARRHAEPAQVFGLNRSSRAQGVEMGLLLDAVGSDGWRECDDGPAACIAATPRSIATENVSPEPTLCGPVVLVRQEPLPWAWSRTSSQESMPVQTAGLEISC